MCGKNNLLRNDVQEAVGSPPHVREEFPFTLYCFVAAGITPRMREEFFDQIHHTLFDRITPAHAGRMPP